MEFYIQINPCNPKELKEYLDILEEKGLLDFTDVEVEDDQQPKEVIEPIEQTWTTNDYPTFNDVRDKMVALNQKGLGTQLIAILGKYGADRVSALKEEHYGEVMHEMEVLENENMA